jgi:hypothetical protein
MWHMKTISTIIPRMEGRLLERTEPGGARSILSATCSGFIAILKGLIDELIRASAMSRHVS